MKLKGNYTQFPNELILYNKLSISARFVLLYILSKPNNWKFSAEKIAKQLKLDKGTVGGYLKELEKCRLLKRVRQRENGKFSGVEYIPSLDEIPVDEIPVDEIPVDEIPVDEIPVDGKTSKTNKTISSKTIINKKTKRESSPYDFLKLNFSSEVTTIENEFVNKFKKDEWDFMITKFNDYYINKEVTIVKLKKWIINEIDYKNKNNIERLEPRPEFKRLNEPSRQAYQDKKMN